MGDITQAERRTAVKVAVQRVFIDELLDRNDHRQDSRLVHALNHSPATAEYRFHPGNEWRGGKYV
jgi:hypothetical protein